MKKLITLALALAFAVHIFAQTDKDMKMIAQVKTTSVKDQQKTGTCWDFATISFLEAEALRLGKEELDLSEMFIVRGEYIQKALDYVRYQGHNNINEGGQAHDVMNAIRNYGLVPQQIYSGLNYGLPYHQHSEMLNGLKGFLDGIMKGDPKKLSTAWANAVPAIVEAYLGKAPQNFAYKGKNYTPQAFASEVTGINADDYVELTSFSHKPFYKPFVLEIPDNWLHEQYYNLPIEELVQVMEYALQNNFSIAWDGDVSENEFIHEMARASVNDKNEAGSKLSFAEIQALRQQSFDNWTTTDDHLMHITGLASDKTGQKYYQTKNSWGPESNQCGGYLFMSEAYVQQKTVAIMIHKKAIPAGLAKKLGIEQ
jgi:bleomycin hydrolase